MGVSAVPGSGKTFILSHLAARLAARLMASGLADESEVLVVTYTNSAVANVRERIARLLAGEQAGRAGGMGLLPGAGYRVRTLHGLAHDIVRERPGLVGLSDEFAIIDDRTAARLKREAVINQLRAHPETITAYVEPRRLQSLDRLERTILNDAVDTATAFLRVAKELRRSPAELQALRDDVRGAFPLFDFGLGVYTEYQRALERRGAVDFDDLIVLALRALESDRAFLNRLQDRWPYVLEDEAQDSTLLQEQMLRKLTRRDGNWVRVGDPNQAIFGSFTSADTRFLQRFLRKQTTQALELPNSGRSTRPILQLANALIDWSRAEHPHLPPDLRLALPHILPTPAGDPQPNPPDADGGVGGIHLYDKPLTPEREIDTVAFSLQRWLPAHPDWTVAVLAVDNHHGLRLTEQLQALGLPFDDVLLRTDAATRSSAQALAALVVFVAQPHEPEAIASVWREVWWPQVGALLHARQEAGASPATVPARTLQRRKLALPDAVEEFAAELAALREPEAFLFPLGSDWLDEIAWLQGLDDLRALVERFRRDLQRWSEAAILPVDELLLTLGNDIFTDPADLALAHRLALLLDAFAREQQDARLPELAAELKAVADNQRKVAGFAEDGEGFVARPGVVTVGTMHSAKGLEWDRVYLMGVNRYSFPAGGADDRYRNERYYLRRGVNLTAEAEAQLRALAADESYLYRPGAATEQARVDFAAERLRLFYVGITRARRELIVSYNLGHRYESDPTGPALTLRALHARQQGTAQQQVQGLSYPHP